MPNEPAQTLEPPRSLSHPRSKGKARRSPLHTGRIMLRSASKGASTEDARPHVPTSASSTNPLGPAQMPNEPAQTLEPPRSLSHPRSKGKARRSPLDTGRIMLRSTSKGASKEEARPHMPASSSSTNPLGPTQMPNEPAQTLEPPRSFSHPRSKGKARRSPLHTGRIMLRSTSKGASTEDARPHTPTSFSSTNPLGPTQMPNEPAPTLEPPRSLSHPRSKGKARRSPLDTGRIMLRSTSKGASKEEARPHMPTSASSTNPLGPAQMPNEPAQTLEPPRSLSHPRSKGKARRSPLHTGRIMLRSTSKGASKEEARPHMPASSSSTNPLGPTQMPNEPAQTLEPPRSLSHPRSKGKARRSPLHTGRIMLRSTSKGASKEEARPHMPASSSSTNPLQSRQMLNERAQTLEPRRSLSHLGSKGKARRSPLHTGHAML